MGRRPLCIPARPPSRTTRARIRSRTTIPAIHSVCIGSQAATAPSVYRQTTMPARRRPLPPHLPSTGSVRLQTATIWFSRPVPLRPEATFTGARTTLQLWFGTTVGRCLVAPHHNCNIYWCADNFAIMVWRDQAPTDGSTVTLTAANLNALGSYFPSYPDNGAGTACFNKLVYGGYFCLFSRLVPLRPEATFTGARTTLQLW